MTESAPVTSSNTTARLKHDIDSGATKDKVAWSDPAASPLGTDDEAAGRPASEERIAIARNAELQPDTHSPRRLRLNATVVFVALLLAVAVVVAIIAVASGW